MLRFRKQPKHGSDRFAKQNEDETAHGQKEKHGLFALSSPQGATVDVIAVHGLGGHAWATWTDKKGHMWLRDSLPNDIPDARIWTYGYDSALAWSNSTSGIIDFARDLLERLFGVQDSKRTRGLDIIFICHSLGGIVVKKALVLATLFPAYESILQSIKAIIFMGTPHKGSRLSSFATPLSRIANTLLVNNPIRSDLLENLSVLSRSLSEISETSVQALSRIPVVSFYEQKKLWPLNRMVVEPSSAILSIVNERAIPINADHRSMARFSPTEPEKYRPVRNAIQDLVERSQSGKALEPKSQEYLQSLYCIDYETLLTDSPQPYAGTGIWLFEDASFLEWARRPSSGICWLQGPPGFGKTVTSRSIIENLKLRTNRVTELEPFGSSTVLYYFFRDEKQETLSELTFLRSILHQLLVEHPQVWSVIDYSQTKPKQTLNDRATEEPFKPELLWKTLENILSMKIMAHTVLVIDALDEVKTDGLSSISQKLVTLAASLKKNMRSQQVKIFVTSRPDHSIKKDFSRSTTIEMGRQKTLKDLETFVSSVVTDFGSENDFPEDIIPKIEDRILSGAEGMFLWAHLVWEHFKEGVTIWSRKAIDARLKSLDQLPRGLEALYERLIMKVDANALLELEPVFMIMCAAAKPLAVDELSVLLAIEGWQRRASEIDVPFSLEKTLERHFPNLFNIDTDGRVNFVHLSLKDFLLARLLKINPSIAHRQLARQCLRYIDFEDFEEAVAEDKKLGRAARCLLKDRFVLYEYAATYLTSHMERVPYTDSLWVTYSKIVRKYDVFHATADPNHSWHAIRFSPPRFYDVTPLLHVLKLNAPTLVRLFVEDGYDINEIVSGDTSLHKFIGNPTLASILLELGASPSIKDSMGRTVLHLALQGGREEMVSKLLALPDIDLNAQDAAGMTPLHYQVASGSKPSLLSDPRVDASKVDNNGATAMVRSAVWGDYSIFLAFVQSPSFVFDHHNGKLSPLIAAAQQQWKEATLQLIAKVSDANNHRGLDGKSIVHWAVINDWEDILTAALARAKAKVNAIDHSGMTGLHYAAKLGLYKRARQLMRHGASARMQDSVGRTAVHTAAVEGFADTLVPLIYESDFDVNEEDDQRRTLVHWAASCDWSHIMTTVLELPTVDIYKRDYQGRNAVHVAALCGCPNVLQRLIDHDAYDIMQTDAFGNTALHLAARGQSLTVVEILIPYYDLHKGRVNRWGQTALDVAVIYSAEAIEAFLRRSGLRFQAIRDPLLEPRRSRQEEEEDFRSETLSYMPTPTHLQLVKQKREDYEEKYE